MDNTPIILSDSDIGALKGKHGVVLFYMDGCNPCNMIKPSWNKAIEELNNNSRGEIILGAVEKGKLNEFNNYINVNHHVNGFPTILYLHPSNHNSPEIYKGNRKYEDIKEWIMEKKNRSSGVKKHNSYTRKNMQKKTSNTRGYQGGGGGTRRRRRSRQRRTKQRYGSRMRIHKRRKSMRRSRNTIRKQSGGGCGCGSGSSSGSSIFDIFKLKQQRQQQEQ
jgi:thiol-disulfide isomerase/thioredoxin